MAGTLPAAGCIYFVVPGTRGRVFAAGRIGELMGSSFSGADFGEHCRAGMDPVFLDALLHSREGRVTSYVCISFDVAGPLVSLRERDALKR